MFRTILDGQQIEQCPTGFDFVGPTAIDVKMKGSPRWIWLENACAEMPDDQVLAIQVPEGEACRRYVNIVRSALCMAQATQMFKWSVRQSKCEKFVVIAKAGEWTKSN